MKTFTITYRLLILSFLTISCENSQKKVVIEHNKVAEDSIKESLNFAENLINKEKIFLKFWDGMSENDYDRVVDTLIKEKKIITENIIYD